MFDGWFLDNKSINRKEIQFSDKLRFMCILCMWNDGLRVGWRRVIITETQIDSSTIDGNVDFVHSVQLYSYVTSVNLVVVFDKIINKSDNFSIKCLYYSKISPILSDFLFLHFFI